LPQRPGKLQDGRPFRAEGFGQQVPDEGGKGRALPAGRNGHRQLPPAQKSRKAKVPFERRVGYVDGDPLPSGIGRHGGVHLTVSGGGKGQGRPPEVCGAVGPGRHLDIAELLADRGLGVDQAHPGAGVPQAAGLASSHRSAAHHHAEAAIEVQKYRVIGHVSSGS
jgi:hypothetical protein